MIDFLRNWPGAGRYGSLYTLPDLLTGDSRYGRPIARFVLPLRCEVCDARYVADSPLALPKPCPVCGGQLGRRELAAWDLATEPYPHWWREESRP